MKRKSKIRRRSAKSFLLMCKGGVSALDIDRARSPAGGWTAETLATWGVPWPPPKGWRTELIIRHEKAQKRRMSRDDL